MDLKFRDWCPYKRKGDLTQTGKKVTGKQEAEIEKLKHNLHLAQYTDIAERHIKAEAYKEFAERLCEDRVSNDPVVIAVKVELKEMVGEE